METSLRVEGQEKKAVNEKLSRGKKGLKIETEGAFISFSCDKQQKEKTPWFSGDKPK